MLSQILAYIAAEMPTGSDHGWDATLLIVNVVIGIIVLALGYFIKRKFDDTDKLVDKVLKGELERVRLEERFNAHVSKNSVQLESLQEEHQSTRKSLHWVGDCLMTIGAKLSVQLPARPE